MQANQVILSFGGGGFTHGSDPELDDFCLRFVPPKPRIGYVGWANGDDATRIARFYARFAQVSGALSHLPQDASGPQTRAWLADKDLVYMAGGNTARLVDAIRANQSLPAFLSANRGGCVLAGVSAGGVCWFDWVLSDSGGTGYRALDGLSVVSGGICPHYSSEPARKPCLDDAVSDRPDVPAYAVDDGACLVSVAGKAESYFSARPGRAAYRLSPHKTAAAVSIRRMTPFLQ